MQITSKVHQKALELGLSAKAISNLDILDLLTLIYQKYNIYSEIYIANEGKPVFKATIIKLIYGKEFQIDEIEDINLNTCSLIEAYENAFIETVNYIQENELRNIKH